MHEASIVLHSTVALKFNGRMSRRIVSELCAESRQLSAQSQLVLRLYSSTAPTLKSGIEFTWLSAFVEVTWKWILILQSILFLNAPAQKRRDVKINVFDMYVCACVCMCVCVLYVCVIFVCVCVFM